MTDLVEREKQVRAHSSTPARLARHFKAWPVALLLMLVAYGVYVAGGLRAAAPDSGVVGSLALTHAVTIYRDARGIPHIRAGDERGAFFAQGFAQASDRLFQMDLIRRYAYGELSEMLGPVQLQTDEQLRVYDVRDIVQRQWRALSAPDRADLLYFAAGVNAAMRTQPLPLEFRLLLYHPRPWDPRDSLAAAMAVAISVDDTADNVLQRDALWHAMSPKQFAQALPLSDPAYDVAANGSREAHPDVRRTVAWLVAPHPELPLSGSNAWASGGARERTGHALLANDPHLSLTIPGIWYALEVRGPHFHAAGVTIPGLPGIVLGHNERIAWAATNAMAATVSLFHAGAPQTRFWKREIFHVRFAPEVEKQYYRTPEEFAVRNAGAGIVLERWPAYTGTRSAIATIFALDRAQDIDGALHQLARYEGPPQNFIIADAGGHVAYHVAGVIPNDPAWGRFVHPAGDLRRRFEPVPFDRLPAEAPSRTAVIVSANNKMYGARYSYRLSPMFAPPYRAYRIEELLRGRAFYDASYFARMQLDVISPADAEFAHRLAAYAAQRPGMLNRSQIAALASWNGSFDPGSTAATFEYSLRSTLEGAALSPYAPFDAVRGHTLPDRIEYDLSSTPGATALHPWGRTGAVNVLHPFGPIGFPFLNAAPFPGNGDRYTIRVQTPEITQSFRAVWRTGDWESGGLSLPSGESGEFGSPHYDDLRDAWVAGRLLPLPFSDAAVVRAARERLILRN